MYRVKLGDFKKNNGIKTAKDFCQVLYRAGLSSSLLSRDVADNIFASLVDDEREIAAISSDNQTTFYIEPSIDDTNAVCLTFGDNYFDYAQINYNRIGNGTNQAAMVRVTRFSDADGCIKMDSCAISLLLHDNEAVLTYNGAPNVHGENSIFAIKVDPYTLDGFGENKQITDTLNDNHALVHFRKSQLRGKNILIKGREQTTLYALHEDMDVYEKGIRR